MQTNNNKLSTMHRRESTSTWATKQMTHFWLKKKFFIFKCEKTTIWRMCTFSMFDEYEIEHQSFGPICVSPINQTKPNRMKQNENRPIHLTFAQLTFPHFTINSIIKVILIDLNRWSWDEKIESEKLTNLGRAWKQANYTSHHIDTEQPFRFSRSQ